MPAHVTVANLSKSYGTVAAVSNVSFTVHRGEVFGVLGRNGAGKTTLLECLAGLRHPDAGHLCVAGIDPRRDKSSLHERLGTVLQRTDLPDQITALEAVRLFGSFYRRSTEADALLARFDLNEKATVAWHALSGGERQRLALALAFLNDPEVVLLDEPSAGLDAQARHEFHHCLRSMRTADRTVLLSTHDLAEAESLCDRVAVMHRGVLVAVGRPRELLAGEAGRMTIQLRTRPAFPVQILGELPDVESVVAEGLARRLVTANLSATLGALSALLASEGANVIELHAGSSLEAAFLSLTPGGDAEP